MATFKEFMHCVNTPSHSQILHLFQFAVERSNSHMYKWTTFINIYSTGVTRVLTVVSWAFYFRTDVCNLCKLLFQTQFLFNYPTIIIICIEIFIKLTINASSMKMNLVTICRHVTKLLKWSRHYVEIRQGQRNERCNHIWVTGTCY